MNINVLLTEPIHDTGIELLKHQGYCVKIGSDINENTILREAADCDAILTRNAIISKKILTSCPKLKVVSMHGVGVNDIDIDTSTKLGIQVTNAALSNQTSVAEYTVGLLLSLAKHIELYHKELQKGNWNIRKVHGMDLAGKTLGIIGMGKIGSSVAKKAFYGFDMNVIGYKRNIVGEQTKEYVTLTSDMDKVITSADFLSLHLPATPATYHVIGKRELSLMKPTAYLINTGRGEVVDEEALITHLQNSCIAGAAIDVFEGNVPDMQNPLLHMPNVITTPHTAAFTSQALERMAYQAALGIVEVLEGKPITFPVNEPLQGTTHKIS